MKRIAEVWFEFKGVRNTEKNVVLMAMPPRYHPAERGEQKPVPGRDGYLWLSDGSYNNTVIRVPCLAPDAADIDAVNAWLSGAGDLRFSDEPNRIYRARVTKEFARNNRFNRFTAQDFTVAFDCHPCRYLYPAVADHVFTTNSAITNPGTYKSEPRIKIEGSGDFSVVVGGTLMEFADISGGIIVDSELGDCLSLDGLTLVNQHAAMDDYPVLDVGPNLISWAGSVSKVTITPRWRYL